MAYLILTKKIAAKILSISSLCYFSLCLMIYLNDRVRIRSLCSREMSGFNSSHVKFTCQNELFGVLESAQDASDYVDVKWPVL